MIKEKEDNIKYWRSIQYREWTKEYKNLIRDEFQQGDSEFTNIQRRDMLKLMGASFMLAGLGINCRRPEDNIIPHNVQTEPLVPGISRYFATTRPSSWGDVGIIAETHEGRPTKIEGNKLHPASFGAAGIHEQAAILELYDPDRSRVPINFINGNPIEKNWKEWDLFAEDYFKNLLEKKGKGFAFLFPVLNSPTVLRLREEIVKKFPEVRFYVHDPLELRNTKKGCREIFGDKTRVLYNLNQPKVILSVHSDFLACGPMSLNYARDFATSRKIYKALESEIDTMNRLYSVEAGFSVTGTNSDHRLPMTVSSTRNFLLELAYELFPEKYGFLFRFNERLNGKKYIPPRVKSISELAMEKLRPVIKQELSPSEKFIKALANDIRANMGQALIIAGEILPPQYHALIHSLNCDLGGYGKTFQVLREPSNPSLEQDLNINDLTADLNNNKISDLVIVETNPIYSTPAELDFEKTLKRASNVIHFGTYCDESANQSNWHLPLSHFLESWGDARAYEGTASLIQPMIAPLHESRSLIELLNQIINPSFEFLKSGLDILKDTWNDIDFDKSLHDGIICDTSYPTVPIPLGISPKSTSLGLEFVGRSLVAETIKNKDIKGNIELILDYDYKILDGRFGNLSWLQELADPVTKITWGNTALISQQLAIQFGIESRVKRQSYEADVISITAGEKTIELPAFIMPGLAEHSIVINLGYGRKNLGAIANNIGINCFEIMPFNQNRLIKGVSIKKINRKELVATTQEQFAINGDAISEISVLSLGSRDPVKSETAQEFVKKEHKETHNLNQLTNSWQYTGNKWGMVIDLSSCIGCNACVIACQSENNIPVVGREEVMRSRIMHWIRVDRYFTGDVKNPSSAAQPVLCMHCENAPCEPVCPVAATVHDTEGLNTMVYNRCVGTRYCGNNCPYKVRRFNYLDYTNSGDIYINPIEKKRNVLLQMQKNPDVTIRYRGVMEKCTFCTQRIQEAKMIAKRNGSDSNSLPDGSVVPACAQTCPTQAITFGNMNDQTSEVNFLKNSDRNYDLLGELNVRPRTSYLKKLKNSNPELT